MLTLLTKASNYSIIEASNADHCIDAAELASELVLETGLEFLIPFNESDCIEFAHNCMLSPKSVLLVAYDVDIPIGFVAGGLANCFFNKKVVQATEFGWYVKPAFRNTGVGHDLHNRYIEWATDNSASVVSMMHMGDKKVGAMYEKMGYALTEMAYTKKVN